MRVVNLLEKNFESIFDEKAFGFLLLCQSLSAENIDSVLLAQTCRLLIQSRHNSLTESNGFRAYSVPLLYFGSLDRLSASSESSGAACRNSYVSRKVRMLHFNR